AVALVIDPSAATRAAGAPLAKEAPSSAPLTAARPPAPQPSQSVPAATAPCPVTPPCPAASPCPACAGGEPSGARAELPARAVVNPGIPPRAAVGPALFGAYGASSLALTAALTWLPDVRTADDRFALGLVTAGAGLCYGRPADRALRLDACAELEL